MKKRLTYLKNKVTECVKKAGGYYRSGLLRAEHKLLKFAFRLNFRKTIIKAFTNESFPEFNNYDPEMQNFNSSGAGHGKDKSLQINGYVNYVNLSRNCVTNRIK